ncbi:Putative multidrug export ATP-binding/permease protein [Pseudidiomarina piscicola]|uniref:Multidrug export ATP-binding/permease protein n=1 Tax=Pseudidiomarina piscicola TaxID=2614830 RepID=A0A6S6WLJ0_9GAMM|nr:ABC transporter ATP-binding protein [Pseudidiomarina piscicola]CAB0150033.1 Putative multidrug export ATP-binding/permease protein [Pseudidiomarina piscicola]VZT39478.1 Putative multidrug export ATP-binding/permease protein [Pseudomonas aeruginosa]
MFRWFERRLHPFPPPSDKQPPTGLIAFCRHYSQGAWGYIFMAGLLMMAIAITEVWLFSFIGNIVDWLSEQNRETLLDDQLGYLIGMAAVVLILLPALVVVHSLVTFQSLLGNYPMRIRWLVHNYLLQQSMVFYQDEFAGRIATKVMQTALAVREAVIKLFDVLNYVGIYFIGTLVIVASADWRLALPLLAWLGCYILLLRYFVPKLGKVATRQADARSVMTGRIVDSYTNIQTVKLFSHSQRESAFAKEGMTTFLDAVHQQMRLVTKLYTCLYLLNSLLLFSVAAIAIWLWLGTLISVGAIAVALSLVLRLWGMSQWIMWEVSALFENIGTVKDGIKTISVPQVIQDAVHARPLAVNEGSVEFDHANFHYSDDKPVLTDFNLTIKAGEKIGLVGRSGAGKSTLVNLLLRFYELNSGCIKIDGQDIKQVTQDSLRAQIAMVTQDTSLLHRSVRGNISYGRPDASDAMIEQAAAQASATEFIADLEDAAGRTGYDAHVGERGVKLSGGQRQRIAIARVMLKDAPLLILDEATSALDSEVEAAIQDNLYRLMQGKTVIAIAHRLSTIAAMDRLVVMDKGRIVEQGTHEELLKNKGLYASLWARQSGGFIAE